MIVSCRLVGIVIMNNIIVIMFFVLFFNTIFFVFLLLFIFVIIITLMTCNDATRVTDGTSNFSQMEIFIWGMSGSSQKEKRSERAQELRHEGDGECGSSSKDRTEEARPGNTKEENG